MKRLGMFLVACNLAAGCNPFTEKRGEAGEACLEGDVCNQGLVCVRDTCFELVDCEASPEPDCSSAGAARQGPDYDGDGWGECCDCAKDNRDINPSAAERCNGMDDNCDELVDETEEGSVCPVCEDEDGDGFGSNCPDGDDCDDTIWAIHPGAPEDCNQVDDDCDGQTDEEVAPRPCPLTQGVCSGVQDTCLADGTWSDCNYGPEHTQDEDTRCDGLDNDCDGQTDEDALLLEPEAGDQASDGLDNNCNGLVDEPGGVLVPHPTLAGVWIGAYEVTVFEDASCLGTRYGQGADDYPGGWPADGTGATTLYACSLPDVVPSGYLSWYRATKACFAHGFYLCSGEEWANACGNGAFYPYHSQFIPGECNDPIGGSGQVEPTGQRAGCTLDGTTFDMSGNLAEWTFASPPEDPSLRGVGGYGFSRQICQWGEGCWTGDPLDEIDRAFFEESLRCRPPVHREESFSPEQVRPWFGARCCYEPH